jgi:cytochrome b561
MTTVQKYPASMILFHTVIAVLMITVLVLGWQLEDNPDLEFWHKAFGISVLFLAFLRILNRMRVGKHAPRSLNAQGSLQYILEKSVHGLLYVVMFSTPLLGWLLVSAEGEPISFFGLFDMPALVGENESLAHTVEGLHELSANLFFGLLLLHLAGAILHRLKNKDSIFRRIMPF